MFKQVRSVLSRPLESNQHLPHDMKPPATQRIASQSLSKLFAPKTSQRAPLISKCCRTIHSSTSDPADVSPFHATGPPPEPPQPAPEHPYAKIERRRKQAELLRQAKELRKESSDASNAAKTPLKKRFWQDVHVKEVDGACRSLTQGGGGGVGDRGNCLVTY